MLRKPLRSLRRNLLDRMVLRPSQHPIHAPTLERVTLPCETETIECFVQRSHSDSEPPDLLILKFPGTAGRAERSTSFPTPMLDAKRTAIWTWNPPGYGVAVEKPVFQQWLMQDQLSGKRLPKNMLVRILQFGYAETASVARPFFISRPSTRQIQRVQD